MGLSKQLGMYTDVQRLFDHILENGLTRVEFATQGAATHWRMRAYHYRKLLHAKQAAALGVEISNTSSPYDSIVIRKDAKEEKQKSLILEELPFNAKIFDADGNEVELSNPVDEEPAAPALPDEDPFAYAANLLRDEKS